MRLFRSPAYEPHGRFRQDRAKGTPAIRGRGEPGDRVGLAGADLQQRHARLEPEPDRDRPGWRGSAHRPSAPPSSARWGSWSRTSTGRPAMSAARCRADWRPPGRSDPAILASSRRRQSRPIGHTPSRAAFSARCGRAGAPCRCRRRAVRQFRKQRQQDRAAAGAEIENAKRRIASPDAHRRPPARRRPASRCPDAAREFPARRRSIRPRTPSRRDTRATGSPAAGAGQRQPRAERRSARPPRRSRQRPAPGNAAEQHGRR